MMLRRFLSIAVGCVALGVGATASAATITVVPTGPNSAPIVVVAGKFEFSDIEEFRSKVASLTKAIVAFNSDGGNAFAGIRIGKLIRLKNFKTAVVDGNRCASACAIAWLGGTTRFMGQRALVGFHAAYNKNTGQETGAGNALVGAYLNEIGLSDPAIYYITKAAPSSITWLTLSDAEKVGIEVRLLGRAPTSVASGTTEGKTIDSASLLQQRAVKFINQLYSWISLSNSEASSNLANRYAESVDYFGSSLSGNDAVDREERFMARWPIREYRADPNTVQATCNSVFLTCDVSGILNFEAASPDRKQISKGKSTFHYRLTFASTADTEPKIVAEDGKVLERSIQPLDTTTGVAVGPASTSEANAAGNVLERRSRQFVDNLYSLISSSNSKAIAELPQLYADPVQYFGKVMPRSKAVAQEARFLARWPLRNYTADENSVSVTCDPAGLSCDVSGTMNLEAKSLERNQMSAGKARFSYRIQFLSADKKAAKIVSEDGKVLDRHVIALSAVATDGVYSGQ